VVEINDRLSSGLSRAPLLLSYPGRQSMESEQTSILGQHDMLLMSVTIDITKFPEIFHFEDAV
jgi:hypothetical protein